MSATKILLQGDRFIRRFFFDESLESFGEDGWFFQTESINALFDIANYKQIIRSIGIRFV